MIPESNQMQAIATRSERGKLVPGVAKFARPKHAPQLVEVYVGAGALQALEEARLSLRKYGESTPALALPLGQDAVAFHWPVRDRLVAIIGTLPEPELRRLLVALMRDGASVTAAMDAAGTLHLASMRPANG